MAAGSIGPAYLLQDCITKLREGDQKNAGAIKLAVKGIKSGEIKSQQNLNEFVNACEYAIRHPTELKHLAAKKLGSLGAKGHLTAQQIDQVTKIVFDSITQGWESKFELTTALTRIGEAEHLSKENKVQFFIACGASVHNEWETKTICQTALDKLI